MKKLYYEKRGRRYYPVSEYDSDLLDSFSKGAHLVITYPGGQSRRYNVEPNYAAMIAAGRIAQEKIAEALRKASDLRPSRGAITEGQRKAWEKLSEEFGEDAHTLTWPSAMDASEEAVKAMMQEADNLIKHPGVRKAYEHFLLMCELTKEQESVK